jgi:hypothetical protein
LDVAIASLRSIIVAERSKVFRADLDFLKDLMEEDWRRR